MWAAYGDSSSTRSPQLKVLRKIGDKVMARIDPDQPCTAGEIGWSAADRLS